MAGAGHNDRGSSGPEAVPPFWLRKEENGVQIIDDRVHAIAEENWHWAFCLVRRDLSEGACTAEVVEHVAVEVTNRLRVEPEVGRNLRGYFRTAIRRRIRTLAIRNSRVAYEGGPQELETNHGPTAPDWTKVCEDRMMLESLLPYVPHPVNHIMHLRLLEYSWKQIAQTLQITEQTAKKRFYRGVRQAYDDLVADRAKRSREKGRD
jgi:DNA-directed RNA polymerase specialized sigma24 family protein